MGRFFLFTSIFQLVVSGPPSKIDVLSLVINLYFVCVCVGGALKKEKAVLDLTVQCHVKSIFSLWLIFLSFFFFLNFFDLSK